MDLENRIARLELRRSNEASTCKTCRAMDVKTAQVRSKLYGMLQELAELKTEQARREALLELEKA